MNIDKPQIRPHNACFSSGPCAKLPGWTVNALKNAALGRSHRSTLGKQKLNRAIINTRNILHIPDNYKIAIVPASDTGAVEIALWSLLGARGVDILSWETFGDGWVNDVKNQLKIDNINHHHADYGFLPDLNAVDFANDVVFTWNGTTSGVRVPNAAWIDSNRQGLTVCDATSAVFAQKLDWDKLDATTYSWQKVLGGEAAHGMIILSPRAIKRLETYKPPWPLPKIFRLTKNSHLISGIFRGETINTPSMLAVEDYLFTLDWVKSIGGLNATIKRANDNLAIVQQFIADNDWVDFLTREKQNQSNTSVCLRIIHPKINALNKKQQQYFIKNLTALLERTKVAYDINAHRDAPPGLRIWCGSTIEKDNLIALMPWLTWAFYQQLQTLKL